MQKCVYCPNTKIYRALDICRRCYDRQRRWKIRGINNMTTQQYYQMLKQQKGKCLFCNREPRANRFFDVDHNHATGEVRGLLCNEHNRAVGVIEKNLKILPKIIDYLSDKA